MRAEQPTKLCKPQRKMRVKVELRKTSLTPPPPPPKKKKRKIIAGRPKAVLSLRFYFSFYAVVC